MPRLRSSPRLTDRPPFALVGVLRIPDAQVSPWLAIGRRLSMAIVLLFGAALIVYLDRGGYRDSAGHELTFLDSLYYATVSLSTTGYGDIVPVTSSTRLLTTVVVTPMRILFLILLVGTTLAVLTERSRQAFRIQRWRQRVRDHTIIVGYGTEGRAAVAALLADGRKPRQIAVVDDDPVALEAAAGLGLVIVAGSGTRADVLRLAGADVASAVIVATNRDDTGVLVTLTAREVAPNAHIVAAIREEENAHLLRQSGADSVLVSSETAGRLLGLATTSPRVVSIIEDLLAPERGMVIAERSVRADEIGHTPGELSDLAIAVVRDGELLRICSPAGPALVTGDKVLVIRGVTAAG